MITIASWKIFVTAVIAFAGGYLAKYLERYCKSWDYLYKGDIDNMGKQRGEVSKKKPYYIPKYRFFELKYYCMQIDDNLNELAEVDSIIRNDISKDKVKTSMVGDPVCKAYMKRELLRNKVQPFQAAVNELSKFYEQDIVNMVKVCATENVGYDIFVARVSDSPCSKARYYEAYHWFFYFLSKYRR